MTSRDFSIRLHAVPKGTLMRTGETPSINILFLTEQLFIDLFLDNCLLTEVKKSNPVGI